MTRSRLRRLGAASLALALGTAGAVLVAQPAAAVEIPVTTLADDGPGSLRAAIVEANGAAGEDVIVFDDGLTGTITLESTIVIEEGLSIEGPGADVITITSTGGFDFFAGTDITGAFEVSDLDFVGVGTGRAMTIDGATGGSVERAVFTGFETDVDGGAIHFRRITGSVQLIDVSVSDSSADRGAGAYVSLVSGDLLVDRVQLLDNEAHTGGGAYFEGILGSLTIRNSLVEGNEAMWGAGIWATGTPAASTTVTDSVFLRNTALGETGGLHIEHVGGVVLIERVRFEGNAANFGGGLSLQYSTTQESNGDSVTVRDSVFVDNSALFGAGLFRGGADPSADGEQLRVESSTFAGNTLLESSDGHEGPSGVSMSLGYVTDGTSVTVINSTFDEDSDLERAPYTISAHDRGGSAELNILHSTVVGPGGIELLHEFSEFGFTANVSHSIISSTRDVDALSVDMWVEGLGYQPDPDVHDGAFEIEWSILSTGALDDEVVLGAGNQLETDPDLGPLQNNGGLTPTMLPNEGSPAIDMGNPAIASAPAADQRGLARVVNRIDIGAVETPAPTLPATGAEATWTLAGGAAAAVLGALVLLGSRRGHRTV